MLLRDDVVTDRQAKPGPLAGGLRGEEWLEQLVAQFRRDAGAVVAHLDLDRLAEVARGDGERRTIAAAGGAPLALPGGIEAVAEQVEEDTRHVLRHDLDGRGLREVPLQRDVEVLILRTGAVIGEVQRLLDQRIDVGLLPVAGAAA